MDKLSLIMVLHCHQPVGNFDHVLAHALERCYGPMLQVLARYPEFKVALHYSGPLLDWLEQNRPDYLDQVAELCARGQVEMLSGGYYEPLLASIPAADAVAQVERMSAYLGRRFGQEPSGFWLAERVWEPSLPAKLAPTGLDYTLVDDTHLYYAGLGEGDMFGYYLTEREGHPLALFPTHMELRYTIPFQEPQATLDFLRRVREERGPLAVTYGDDGEKFGLWPGTYQWVIEKGWLDRFIQAVLAAGNWLATVHPGEYRRRRPASGRVYLPTASYEEMLTWALPAEASRELESIIARLKQEGTYREMRRFLRGGLWDNFLVKYRESNLMHKRMLYISRKLHQEGAPQAAWDHLYQAQCNCAYWHGLFGGLYLGHLRHAVHQHLIAAESLADAEQRGETGWAHCRVEDLDRDGNPEVILAGPELDLVVHPAYGGSVSVLDLRRACFNLAGALTRRPEAYHAHLEDPSLPQPEEKGVKSIHDQVVLKEAGLEKLLVYDWYQRCLFQDHLLPPHSDPAAFADARYREWGDFVDQPYRLGERGSQGAAAWCRLLRRGRIWAPDGPWPLAVAKDYRLGPGLRLALAYGLEAERPGTPGFTWAVELNFSLLAQSDPDKRLETAAGRVLGLEEPWQVAEQEELVIIDERDGFRLRLTPTPPAAAWCFPIYTVSHSESGLERTYQGSSLTLLWSLPPGGGVWELGLVLQGA